MDPYGHNHHHSHRRDDDRNRQEEFYPPPGEPYSPPPQVTHVHHSSHAPPPPRMGYEYDAPPPPFQGNHAPPYQGGPPPPQYDASPYSHGGPPPPQYDAPYSHGGPPPPQYDAPPYSHGGPPPPQYDAPPYSHGGPPPPSHGGPPGNAFVEHVSHQPHHPQRPSFPDHRPEVDNRPTVRVYCKAKTDYSLSIRDGKVILARPDPSDPHQHWIKDEKFSTRVKDEEGFPSFALVNKATGQAIKHSVGSAHPVQLIPYNPDFLDESVLWTLSHDTGENYRTIRMVNNIRLNVDAWNGDKYHGGVRDGTTIYLWEWKKGENQRWKIEPYCKSCNVLTILKFCIFLIFVPRFYKLLWLANT